MPLTLPAYPSPTNTHQPARERSWFRCVAPPPPPWPPGLWRGGEAQLDHLCERSIDGFGHEGLPPSARSGLGRRVKAERRVAAKKGHNNSWRNSVFNQKMVWRASNLACAHATRPEVPLTVCLCVSVRASVWVGLGTVRNCSIQCKFW